ncbi:MAG TPA: hypothetical protein DCR78_08900 [Pseudomonas sp.]|jgi:hypothetical protein|nr:hypothetical protein [Pseudomonas sp.]
MQSISLAKFTAELGQAKAAQALGVTQGSLSKALRVGRHVFVIRHESGDCEAMELRAFPAQGRAKQGASIDEWLEALCPLPHQAA